MRLECLYINDEYNFEKVHTISWNVASFRPNEVNEFFQFT
jgi:hypothetical protein